MQFAIWGAGAVGLGLANALARENTRLGLIGRDPETRGAIQKAGIKRTGLFGDRHAPPESLAWLDDPAQLLDAPPEWLLICVKAHATEAIARALEPHAEALAKTTRLVLCQNGWGNEAPLLPFWPRERLFHGRVITGFHRREPHHVEVTAHAAPIAVGSIFDRDDPRIAQLTAAIDQGGLPAAHVPEMRRVLWAKMLYNCALNPLGALTRRRYGELVADAVTRKLVDQVIREVFAVLSAAQIEVDWTGADAYLTFFHDELIPPTAEHESSMLQDLQAGRTTEIEALCGAVEQLGRSHEVETPVVSSLAALVRTVSGNSRE